MDIFDYVSCDCERALFIKLFGIVRVRGLEVHAQLIGVSSTCVGGPTAHSLELAHNHSIDIKYTYIYDHSNNITLCKSESLNNRSHVKTTKESTYKAFPIVS